MTPLFLLCVSSLHQCPAFVPTGTEWQSEAYEGPSKPTCGAVNVLSLTASIRCSTQTFEGYIRGLSCHLHMVCCVLINACNRCSAHALSPASCKVERGSKFVAVLPCYDTMVMQCCCLLGLNSSCTYNFMRHEYGVVQPE